MNRPADKDWFQFDGAPEGRLDVLGARLLDRLAERHIEEWPRVRKALVVLFGAHEEQGERQCS